jgi:aldose 1-epimerase
VSANAHSSGVAGVDRSILDAICSTGARLRLPALRVEALVAALELRAGPSRAFLDPVRGGRVASWVVDGEELLVGPPHEADSSIHWGCFVMAPWPGRLANARFEWGGRTIQLRRTHGRHAIHGLTWNRPWVVEAVTAASASLSIELPHDEWPMGGRVRQRVRLGPSSLRLEAEIEAHHPMPAALGWHPWFRSRGDPRLRVEAATYAVTVGMVPTGAAAEARGSADLRAGPRLGRRRLDLAYLEARSPAVVTWPDQELRIAFEPAPAPFVVYTPRGSFCVEPLTAPPNALALGSRERRQAGVRELGAGERLSATMTLSLAHRRGRA